MSDYKVGSGWRDTGPAHSHYITESESGVSGKYDIEYACTVMQAPARLHGRRRCPCMQKLIEEQELSD